MVKLWNDLPLDQQLKLSLRAYDDPVFFAENEYFLGMKLWPMQREILSKFYTYDPERCSRVYNELILICGMRASKTVIGSVINCFETFRLMQLEDPAAHYGLLKGTEIFLINVAINDRQARDTIFAKTFANISNSPWFQAQTYNDTYDEIRFPVKRIVIRSSGSSSSSIVGRTVKTAFFDEISRMLNTAGQRSGRSMYESLGRSVATFGMEGLKVVTSSPMYVDDVVMELERESIDPLTGKTYPNVLLYHKPTWEMNPELPRDSQFMQNEYRKNPEAFMRDFGAQPSLSIEAFFREPSYIKVNPKRLNWADLTELPPIDPAMDYRIAVDVATRFNAYGICCGHKDEDRVIVDLMTRFVPIPGKTEVDAREAAQYIKKLVKHTRASEVLFDIAGYPETMQMLHKELEVDTPIHNPLKAEYDILKELVYTERIDMCNYPYIIEELRAIELQQGKNIHTTKTKDVSDTVANLCWSLLKDERATKHEQLPTPLYVATIRRR